MMLLIINFDYLALQYFQTNYVQTKPLTAVKEIVHQYKDNYVIVYASLCQSKSA